MGNIVYLSLGSNIGDREANLRKALALLEEHGRVTRVSPFYETEPVEYVDQPWFLNCAAEMETQLSPHGLLDALLSVERSMGRQRTQPKGPRLIDLDILLFGDLVVDESDLKIPHPSMHERRFVLEPLSAIAPEARHAKLNKTAREMLADLPQGSPIVKRVRSI